MATPNRPDPLIGSFCEAQITQALTEILEIRRRVILSGIALDDQQFFVDFKSHIYLMDADLYRFDVSTASHLPVHKEINRLIELWEISSGKRYSANLKAEFLKLAQVTYLPCTQKPATHTFRHSIRCESGQEAESAVIARLREEFSESSSSSPRIRLENVWPDLIFNYANLTWSQRALLFAGELPLWPSPALPPRKLQRPFLCWRNRCYRYSNGRKCA